MSGSQRRDLSCQERTPRYISINALDCSYKFILLVNVSHFLDLKYGKLFMLIIDITSKLECHCNKNNNCAFLKKFRVTQIFFFDLFLGLLLQLNYNHYNILLNCLET